MKIIRFEVLSTYSIGLVKHPMFDKMEFHERNIIIHEVMQKLRYEKLNLYNILFVISALSVPQTFTEDELTEIQNGLEEIKIFFTKQLKILKYPFSNPLDLFKERIPWEILETKEEFVKFTKKSVLAQWVKMKFVPVYLRALVAFRYNRHRYMLEEMWENRRNRLEIELAFAQACFERQIIPRLACLPNLFG